MARTSSEEWETNRMLKPVFPHLVMRCMQRWRNAMSPNGQRFVH